MAAGSENQIQEINFPLSDVPNFNLPWMKSMYGIIGMPLLDIAHGGDWVSSDQETYNIL